MRALFVRQDNVSEQSGKILDGDRVVSTGFYNSDACFKYGPLPFCSGLYCAHTVDRKHLDATPKDHALRSITGRMFLTRGRFILLPCLIRDHAGGSSNLLIGSLIIGFPNYMLVLLQRMLRLLLPPASPSLSHDSSSAPAPSGAGLMDLRWAALTLVARFLAHGCRRDGQTLPALAQAPPFPLHPAPQRS